MAKNPNNQANVFANFQSIGEGVVGRQEWVQFLTWANLKLNTLYGLITTFQLITVPTQATLPANSAVPLLAYEKDNGVLWYFNVFDGSWEKVGIILP